MYSGEISPTYRCSYSVSARLIGNDKDEWAANYLYNLPGKGWIILDSLLRVSARCYSGLGAIEGALNSDQQLALQYSNAIPDGTVGIPDSLYLNHHYSVARYSRVV